MQIVLFTHPSFLDHQSMPRFAKMVKEGMQQKGHEVIVWSPTALFFKLAFNKPILEKWLGYLDQYVVFPILVQYRLFNCSKDTLFVFADNALGPWIPLVNKRKHVVHCHDFLAQQSAFGLLPENKTGLTGKYYQKFIRWGYRKADNFICISKKTQSDLHLLLTKAPKISQVVYNGLNQKIEPVTNKFKLREKLSNRYSIDLSKGYILHVGGNAFYKNKLGVLEIYDQWTKDFEVNVPLILVGELPTEEMIVFKEKSIASKSIYFITNIDDLQLQQFYQGASVMVFPSLYEGFGWPIIEAMASGSLVITTNEDPMREVAGDAGFYIPKKTFNLEEMVQWKKTAAQELDKVMQLNPILHDEAIQKSILRSKEFSSQGFINSIEMVYQQIIQNK
ncbi:glycosyltransferase [Flavobacterium cellulosilyticum]|uniref:Glycosyltransferase n=1 Tax=Flavobacterium cellulosilyticum TaxID=2541731 RepID=A0A4R5C4Q0_9FLAO|nr:glycosyltransferase [Flavobacterium cellulosilyticum]TDD94681.1 glycosyltransferase [Flavobacterium cellulosilyticum]